MDTPQAWIGSDFSVTYVGRRSDQNILAGRIEDFDTYLAAIRKKIAANLTAVPDEGDLSPSER